MSVKAAKWLSSSLVAMGFWFVGCSETNTVEPVVSGQESVYIKNDAKGMWARIDESGSIANYFDSLSKEPDAPIIVASPHSGVRCAAPALQMDDHTRYLDELETLFEEGEIVEGVCGKALKLNDGQVAPLGVNLIDSMRVGTVEFWFRPNADFYDAQARTLLGNDGARIHFFYKDGELFFQKNHHNLHYFVNGKVEFKENDWNLVAGQWGDGYMSVWVNGELVGYRKHDKGYVPAQRGIQFENLVVIGYKSSCCMEGPGVHDPMTTSGSFDQFRISNITRYKLNDKLIDAKDSVEVVKEPETSIVDTMIAIKDPVTVIADTVITVDTLLVEVEPDVHVIVEKKPVFDTTIYEKRLELVDTTWHPVVKKCCKISDDYIIKKPIELDITDSL